MAFVLIEKIKNTTWHEDILGNGFEMCQYSFNIGKNIRKATLVRKSCVIASNSAILYIHGYNDYFFHEEMANRFISNNINFYAIDLMGYGRSLSPKETPFDIKDISQYFSSINIAISLIKQDNISNIVLFGHSTGGLISSCYINENSTNITGVILNSPFLDWNLKPFLKKIMIPIVSYIGKYIPNIKIKQPTTIPYSQSLLSEFHGEWNYNTSWKFIQAPSVTSQWIRAINIAQQQLRKSSNISIPILLLRSDNSVYGSKWSPKFNNGDAILSVNDISKYGSKLGFDVTERIIKNGIHDLVLSSKPIRNNVYNTIFDWINSKGICQ